MIIVTCVEIYFQLATRRVMLVQVQLKDSSSEEDLAEVTDQIVNNNSKKSNKLCVQIYRQKK
jgi:hypothetical protein